MRHTKTASSTFASDSRRATDGVPEQCNAFLCGRIPLHTWAPNPFRARSGAGGAAEKFGEALEQCGSKKEEDVARHPLDLAHLFFYTFIHPYAFPPHQTHPTNHTYSQDGVPVQRLLQVSRETERARETRCCEGGKGKAVPLQLKQWRNPFQLARASRPSDNPRDAKKQEREGICAKDSVDHQSVERPAMIWGEREREMLTMSRRREGRGRVLIHDPSNQPLSATFSSRLCFLALLLLVAAACVSVPSESRAPAVRHRTSCCAAGVQQCLDVFRKKICRVYSRVSLILLPRNQPATRLLPAPPPAPRPATTAASRATSLPSAAWRPPPRRATAAARPATSCVSPPFPSCHLFRQTDRLLLLFLFFFDSRVSARRPLPAASAALAPRATATSAARRATSRATARRPAAPPRRAGAASARAPSAAPAAARATTAAASATSRATAPPPPPPTAPVPPPAAAAAAGPSATTAARRATSPRSARSRARRPATPAAPPSTSPPSAPASRWLKTKHRPSLCVVTGVQG